MQQQSTVNPAGQLGAQPSPTGQEMTYTVRAQGRLQTAEEFGAIAVRSNPDGSMVRLSDVARLELGALNYQQIGRVDGQPGVGIGVFQMPGSNALEVAAAVKKTMAELSQRFPPDLTYSYSIDTTLPVTQGSSSAVTMVERILSISSWMALMVSVVVADLVLLAIWKSPG